jgi:hypothetical protein
MNITQDLSVKIQARFEGSTETREFFDVSARIDSDNFEFTSSADGSTASATIGLYTLFPISSKRWSEYTSGQEAINDPMFRFEIPARAEVKIYEGDTLLFGGVVMEVAEERVGGAIIQKITCADYTALLDERVIDRYRIPRDTYGWEMVKGGQAYDNGLVGIYRINTYANDPSSTTVTFVSYDSNTGVAEATAVGHTFVSGEMFTYSGTEYEIVSVKTDGIYYRRASASGNTSIAGTIKIWSHVVEVTTAGDHLYAITQKIKFPNIAHFSSTYYIVKQISDSQHFVTEHHVGLASGSTASTFTDVTIVNIRRISGINQSTAFYAQLETSVEHLVSNGATIYITQSQIDTFTPWLDSLTESPANSDLYPVSISILGKTKLQVGTSASRDTTDVEITNYDDGYPIESQAYTRSFFESIRYNDPFSGDYDGLEIDYQTYVKQVENRRYNPILYAAKEDHPITLKDSSDNPGTSARVWVDFSRKGAENDVYTFSPIVTSTAASVPHLYRIPNRSLEERVLGKLISEKTISISSGVITVTCDNNFAVGDKVLITKVKTLTANQSAIEKELTITACTTSDFSIDLSNDSNGALISTNWPTLAASSTCAFRLMPAYNSEDQSLKIYTERPHSLEVGQEISLSNYKLLNNLSQIQDASFPISAVNTAHDPAGGKYSSVSFSVGAVDPAISLQPNAEITDKSKTTIGKVESGELNARSIRYRPIHARRKDGISEVTLISAEIIKDWAVKDADSWYAYLDEEADSFFATNHVVRVLSLPYPFNGRWEVTEVSGRRITLARTGVTNIFTSYAKNTNGASYSGGYITYTFPSAHPFTAGQKIRAVNLAPSGYNVSDAVIYDVPSANSIRVASSNPGTNTDNNGTIFVEDFLESTPITAMSRDNVGTSKRPVYRTKVTAPNHNLIAGQEIIIDLTTVPDSLLIEDGAATVHSVINGSQFYVASDGAGSVTTTSSPSIVGNIVRTVAPTQPITALGLMVSRVDDSIVSNESFFIRNTGDSNFDRSTALRVGNINRREFLVTATSNSKVFWANDGVVTFYFNQALNDSVDTSFSEGRSMYSDLSVTGLTNDTEALSGIYTIFEAGTVLANDMHDARGIDVGTKYIQWFTKKPSSALKDALYSVNSGSVLSADFIEYRDDKAQDTTPYTMPTGTAKTLSGGSRKVSITAAQYRSAGTFRFESANHKLANGNYVYLSGTGFSSSNLSSIATSSSKQKVKTDGANAFLLTFPGTQKVNKISSPLGSNTWTIQLAAPAPQLSVAGLYFNIIGIPTTATNYTKALNNGSTGWPLSGCIISADRKTITLATGPYAYSAVVNGAGPNTKITFNYANLGSFSNAYAVKPGTVRITGTVFDSASARTALGTKAAGVSDLNYYNDLKIKRKNSPEIYRYYYDSSAKTYSGTYTIASGTYTVTLNTSNVVGSYQPNVTFTPSVGSAINISGHYSNAVKSTGEKTLQFVSGSSTNAVAQNCTITVRSDFTADHNNSTMPRVVRTGRIGARQAAYWPEDQWAVLRGQGFGFDGGDPTVSGGTTNLSQTWAFAIQPKSIPGDGHHAVLAAHGSLAGAPYISFGIGNDAHPWVSFFTNSSTRTKYSATNITLTAEDDCVLLYRVVYTSATAATVYVSLNTGSEQSLSVPTIHRGSWNGTLEENGSTATTLILGAELEDLDTYRYPYHGYIGEIVAFDRDIGQSDGLALRAWMLHKWSLTQLIDDNLTPDYREARNIPNYALPDEKQVKNAYFNGRTLKQALEQLSNDVSADFWVDKNKNLHFQEIKTENLIPNSILQDDRANASSKNWTLGSMTLAETDDADATIMPGPFGYGNTIRYSGTAGASAYSDFIDKTETEESIVAGQYYFVSAMHKSTDVTKTNLRVHFYNSGANTVGSAYSISYEDSSAWMKNNSWDKLWAIVKVPSGATKLTLSAYAASSASTVTAHWTDFLCVRLTGSFGFADEGMNADGYPYLNNGQTDGAAIPMPMYDFETPDNISTAASMANRLRMFTMFLESGEDGVQEVTDVNTQSVIESVYDDVRGIWRAHGKIIEAPAVNDKAMTQYEITGTAKAKLKEFGSSGDSYTFEHQTNGQNGLLEVGSVVPFIWSEVGIYQPMVVKTQTSKLTGTQMYHSVTLNREPDYQKNALVMISRRRISADLASVPEVADQIPVPTDFVAEAIDMDGKLSTVDTDFRFSWDYAFDDPLARGVREKGFEMQVRYRARKKATTLTEKQTQTVSFGTSEAGSPVLVTVKLRGTTHALIEGQPFKIGGIPFASADTQQVNGNGTFRVHQVLYNSDKKTGFSYYVPARSVTLNGETTYVDITKVRTLTYKQLATSFEINYTQKQGGDYSSWKNINTVIIGTQFRWSPSSGSGVGATSTEQVSALAGDHDLDFQFRLRAKGGPTPSVAVYSPYVKYPSGDAFITIAAKESMEG